MRSSSQKVLKALKFQKRPKPAEYMPCASYVLGVGATDFEALSHAINPKKFGESLPTIGGHDVIANTWNGIDAACNIKTALDLWNDKDNYYPCKTVLIGLNLASAANLLTLTDSFHSGPYFGVAKMGAGSFMAAPAFAFAMLCDLVAAGIEWYYSTEEGYLKRMIGEMEFLAKKINELEQELVADSLNIEKQSRLETFEDRQAMLIGNIKEQMDYYFHATDPTKKPDFYKFLEEQQQKITGIVKDYGKTKELYDEYHATGGDQIHNQIEEVRLRVHKVNTYKLAVKATSFGGMLLQAMPHILLLAGVTAVVPFLNMAMFAVSLVAISTVAAVYLYQLMTMPDGKKALPSSAVWDGYNLATESDSADPLSPTVYEVERDFSESSSNGSNPMGYTRYG